MAQARDREGEEKVAPAAQLHLFAFLTPPPAHADFRDERPEGRVAPANLGPQSQVSAYKMALGSCCCPSARVSECLCVSTDSCGRAREIIVRATSRPKNCGEEGAAYPSPPGASWRRAVQTPTITRGPGKRSGGRCKKTTRWKWGGEEVGVHKWRGMNLIFNEIEFKQKHSHHSAEAREANELASG